MMKTMIRDFGIIIESRWGYRKTNKIRNKKDNICRIIMRME